MFAPHELHELQDEEDEEDIVVVGVEDIAVVATEIVHVVVETENVVVDVGISVVVAVVEGTASPTESVLLMLPDF